MDKKDKVPEQPKIETQGLKDNPCGPDTMPYTVREGDTFFTIARQFDVGLDDLAGANPQITDPCRIVPGQTLCIPQPVPTFDTQEEPPEDLEEVTAQQVQCPPGSFRYTVQPGDSMWLIAQRFGVSLDALIAANPQIPNPTVIFPGQVVCVPTSPPPPGCPPGSFRYTVQPGDSMWLIAQRFGVSLDALIAANPQISDPSRIFPGQVICVPTSPPPPGCPPGTFRYTVQPGDSMWSIARRFGVSLNALIAANPQISDPSRIFPGQVICVPNR